MSEDNTTTSDLPRPSQATMLPPMASGPADRTAALPAGTQAEFVSRLVTTLRSRRGFCLVLAVLMGTAGIVWRAASRSHAGTVTVSVSGPDDMAIEQFAISVDGRPRCSVAPCAFPLESGTHELVAEADGYLPYEHVLAIASGSVLAVNITLRKIDSASAFRIPGN